MKRLPFGIALPLDPYAGPRAHPVPPYHQTPRDAIEVLPPNPLTAHRDNIDPFESGAVPYPGGLNFIEALRLLRGMGVK